MKDATWKGKREREEGKRRQRPLCCHCQTNRQPTTTTTRCGWFFFWYGQSDSRVVVGNDPTAACEVLNSARVSFFPSVYFFFSPPTSATGKKSHIGSRRGPSLLFRQAALRALMEGKIRGREKWKMRGKTHCDNGPFIIPRDLERGAAPPLQAGRPPRKFFMGRKKVNWATKKRHKHKLFSRPCPQCPASGRPPFPNPLSPTSTQTLLPPPPSSSCFKA